MELTDKRSANQGPIRLDQPVAADTATTLGQLTPLAGPTVTEQAEHRDTLRLITRNLRDVPRHIVAAADLDNPTPRAVRLTKLERKLCQHVARGGPTEERIVYTPRDRPSSTAASVARRARTRNPGWIVASVTKRKLLNGRDRAPQGRPTLDGNLGEPVWKIVLLRPLTDPAATPAIQAAA